MKNGSNTTERAYEEWEIEKTFTGDVTLSRLCRTWEIPLFFSVFYLVMVFGGKKYMSTRPSYTARPVMFVWSSLLALFSIVGMMRTMIVVSDMIQDGGIHHVICSRKIYDGPISRLWSVLFTYSKFLEYGDTAFIILRKQNLIFLHWYHHLTVALFCWLMYGGKYAGGSLFMFLNYVVHSFMYCYYAVRAAGIKTPRFIALGITTLQIIQMILGCCIMLAVLLWGNSSDCPTSFSHLTSGILMYSSYLALFVHFFYKSYMQNRQREAVKSSQKLSNSVINEQSSQISSAENSKTNSYNLRRRATKED